MKTKVQEAIAELRSVLSNEPRTDDISRAVYATDASMYQFMPMLVIEPVSRQEIIDAIRICHRFRLPILPRGGGTSLVGQSVGTGVIIDVSRHFNRILELNLVERWIRVEPGITRDELNRHLAPHKLHFAPDPATSSRANIGGMIASNSAGMRSLKYGMTIDHILSIELALSTGDVVTLGPVNPNESKTNTNKQSEGLIRSLFKIIDRERDEIVARYPRVGRRSGGYALDAFLAEPPWNAAKLIAGSEGTLGVILEAKLSLVPLPAHSMLCLAHFNSITDCLSVVQSIVGCEPSAVELLDGLILQQARRNPHIRQTCRMIEGEPQGLLIIESRGDDHGYLEQTMTGIRNLLIASGKCYACPIITESTAIKAVWQMRENALGLMTTIQGDRKPTPYIEDAAVPLEVLAEYVTAVLDVCKKYGQPVSLFAHAGAGLLHIRPLHDLHQRVDIDQMLRIQDEVFFLVQKYKGSWSGEHGDGIIRGGFNHAFFGNRIYQAFREIKCLFDPAGLMNPGKILDTPPRDGNLRHQQTRTFSMPMTGFQWREEINLLRATEQCTGIGACRKVKDGVMCPSYMATRDEIHSTRGRANILRLALSGQLGTEALSRDDVMAAFDLCLSCKGCRTECPNQVDVGKMKSELLHQRYQNHRIPLRSRLFIQSSALGSLFSGRAAPFINAVLQAKLPRRLLDKLIGIDRRRTLPLYTTNKFSKWFTNRRPSTASGDRTDVILLNDPYIEYHHPEVGQSLVRVLEACGFSVHLLDMADCQRPAISLGLLDRARFNGTALFQRISEKSYSHAPVIAVEPSCYTALTQELPDLISDSDLVDAVTPRLHLADQFILKHIQTSLRCPGTLAAPGMSILLHPHCHQQSIDKGRSSYDLLRLIDGATVTKTNAGCCGMAGSFGYEKEHYDLSVQIAGDRLLPAINGADDRVILATTGFSCRHQITELTGRKCVHPIEIIDRVIHQHVK